MFKSFIKKLRKKESRVSRLHVSSGSGPIYSDKDYENHARETYLKNTIAFRCICDIAEGCSAPRWELHERISADESKIVTDHEINDLIRRPNPEESFNKLVYKFAAFLVMAGNSFFERVMLQTRQVNYPSELYVLRPDRIKLIPDIRGHIGKYEYRTSYGVEYFEVDPITRQSDLLHVKLFHPINDFWGAAPVEPASREIDSSNEATDWNMSLIRNQGRPGLVFTVIGDISEEDFDRLEEMLDEKFSGPDNVGKNIIITGDKGTKVEPYTFKPSEMEFTEGGRELARRIALTFGEPPMLLGIPGDNTYSNQKEARLAFYETTITFYLNLIRNELNNWLFNPKKDRLFLKYNMDDIPAMEPRWETKWKRATEADFLTVNEKRELVGYEKDANGDVILVSAGAVALSDLTSEEEVSVEEEIKDLDLDDEEYNLVMGLDE